MGFKGLLLLIVSTLSLSYYLISVGTYDSRLLISINVATFLQVIALMTISDDVKQDLKYLALLAAIIALLLIIIGIGGIEAMLKWIS